MTGNGAKIWTGGEKSLVEMRIMMVRNGPRSYCSTLGAVILRRKR
jgi:hypothetical protein